MRQNETRTMTATYAAKQTQSFEFPNGFSQKSKNKVI